MIEAKWWTTSSVLQWLSGKRFIVPVNKTTNEKFNETKWDTEQCQMCAGGKFRREQRHSLELAEYVCVFSGNAWRLQNSNSECEDFANPQVIQSAVQHPIKTCFDRAVQLLWVSYEMHMKENMPSKKDKKTLRGSWSWQFRHTVTGLFPTLHTHNS